MSLFLMKKRLHYLQLMMKKVSFSVSFSSSELYRVPDAPEFICRNARKQTLHQPTVNTPSATMAAVPPTKTVPLAWMRVAITEGRFMASPWTKEHSALMPR